MGKSKAGKMLQDLEYEKIEIIVTILNKIRSIKKIITYFEKQLQNI